MDSYEKVTGFPRETQTIVLELGTPNTANFLHKEYELPKPYTVEEYTAALDDLNACWEKGERTVEGGTCNV